MVQSTRSFILFLRCIIGLLTGNKHIMKPGMKLKFIYLLQALYKVLPKLNNLAPNVYKCIRMYYNLVKTMSEDEF